MTASIETLKALALRAADMVANINKVLWDMALWNEYVRAANPQAILSLIAELEAARAQVEKLQRERENRPWGAT